MKAIACGVFLLALCVLEVTSLKCYICTDVKNATGCGHGADVDPAFLKDCNSQDKDVVELNPVRPTNKEFTLCRKMVTQVDFDVNSNKAGSRIKRTCGWDDEDKKYVNACYYRGGLGGRINVCSCDTNDCNGSNFMKASMGLGLTATLLSVWKVFC
jgi:hypothetical protein